MWYIYTEHHQMNALQNFLKAILPRAWGESMERESRSWFIRCEECGYELSVWEAGGVRWKAAGNPRKLGKCPTCERPRMFKIYKKS